MGITKKECEKICNKFGVKLDKIKLLGRGAHNEILSYIQIKENLF